MSDVTITIGCATNFDPNTIFAPLIAASKKAADQIRQNLDGAIPKGSRGGGGGGGGGGGNRPGQGPSGEEKSTKYSAKSLEKSMERLLHTIDDLNRNHREAIAVEREKQRLATRETGYFGGTRLRGAEDRRVMTDRLSRQLGVGAYRKIGMEEALAREKVRAENKAIKQAARDKLGLIPPSVPELSKPDKWRQSAKDAVERRRLLQAEGLIPKPQSALSGLAQSVGRHVFMRGYDATVGSAISWATGLPMEVARGAGFDFSVGSAVQRATGLESTLGNLANQAWIPSEGKGLRSKESIMARIRPTANAAGYSYEESAEALSKFVAKTGDLDLGLSVFDRMARLSKATGANLADMVDAVADVSNGLGNIKGKDKVMESVMKTLAGQGKVGAVEIRDMATQLGKMAAIAPHFASRNAAGEAVVDPGQSMKTLGGFAQIIRSHGGKASASATFTSLQAFFNQFAKTARLKGFAELGVNPIIASGEAEGLIDDPRNIIKDLIGAAAKKGSGLEHIRNLTNTAIADERAKPIVTALTSTFMEGYKSLPEKATQEEKIAAGKAAIQAEYDRMDAIAVSDAEIESAFRRMASNTESSAARMNNAMTDAGEKLKTTLMTTLVAIGPKLLDGIKTLGAFAEGVATIYKGILKTHAPEAYEQTFGVTENQMRSEKDRFRADLASGKPVLGGEVKELVTSAATRSSLKWQAANEARAPYEEKRKEIMDVAVGEGLSANASDKDIAAWLETNIRGGGARGIRAGTWRTEFQGVKGKYDVASVEAEKAQRDLIESHNIAGEYENRATLEKYGGVSRTNVGVASGMMGAMGGVGVPGIGVAGVLAGMMPDIIAGAQPRKEVKATVDSASMSGLQNAVAAGAKSGVESGMKTAPQGGRTPKPGGDG